MYYYLKKKPRYFIPKPSMNRHLLILEYGQAFKYSYKCVYVLDLLDFLIYDINIQLCLGKLN